MSFWEELAKRWQEQDHAASLEVYHVRKDTSAPSDNNLYSATCLLCYEVHLGLNSKDLDDVTCGTFPCCNCGERTMFHVQHVGHRRPESSEPQPSEEAIQSMIGRFEVNWSWWLKTDEGRLAQEKARYEL